MIYSGQNLSCGLADSATSFLKTWVVHERATGKSSCLPIHRRARFAGSHEILLIWCANVLIPIEYEMDIRVSVQSQCWTVQSESCQLNSKSKLTYLQKYDASYKNIRVCSEWLKKIAQVKGKFCLPFGSSSDRAKINFTTNKPTKTSLAVTSVLVRRRCQNALRKTMNRIFGFVLRVEDEDGVELSFVIGEWRNASMKLQTIPKLELQAALYSVRLRPLIIKDHDIPIGTVKHWTDSMNVLHWLRWAHKRQQVFVANWVGKLPDQSTVNERRLLKSIMNAADIGTRGFNVAQLLGKEWLNGPAWLKQNPSGWPSKQG